MSPIDSAATPAVPNVLVINGRGNLIDGILPIGLIQAVNLLEVPKRGIFYFQLTQDLVRDAQIVVMHLHWDFNFIFFSQIVRFVRRHNPGVKIIVGGYISTVHSHRLLRDLPIDYCLIRDSEFAFKWLVDALLAGRSSDWITEHVPNVVSRTGESRIAHKPSRQALGQLDSFELGWFPQLETYLRFQDALSVIGPRRFRTEEQYFPAIIIKGSFDRSCKFCALGNQSFQGFCEPERYTYLLEEDFVQILERTERAGFHMLNVFGDFAGLSIERILTRIGQRRFSFELTIGDFFKRLDPELIIQLGRCFRALTLLFRTLPPAHFVGRKQVSLLDFDRDADEELFRRLENHTNITVGFWLNGKNVAPDFDSGPYGDRLKYIDSWLPYPTQSPTDASYRKLSRMVHDRVDGTFGRSVLAALQPIAASSRGQPAGRDFPTPFTQLLSGEQAADLQRRVAFEPLLADELGVFHLDKECLPDGQAAGLELMLLDKKAQREWELRRFHLPLPAEASRGPCAIRYGDHLGTARIGAQPEQLLISTAEDIHGFTSPEEREQMLNRWTI